MLQCLERLQENFGPDAAFVLNESGESVEQTLAEWIEARRAVVDDERPDPDTFGLDFRTKNVFVWAEGQDRRVDAITARDTCVMHNADFDPTAAVAARNPVLTWKPTTTGAVTAIPKLVDAYASNGQCALTHPELVQLMSSMAMFGMGRPVLPGAQGVVPKLFAAVSVNNPITLTADEVRQLLLAGTAFGMIAFAPQETPGPKKHTI